MDYFSTEESVTKLLRGDEEAIYRVYWLIAGMLKSQNKFYSTILLTVEGSTIYSAILIPFIKHVRIKSHP